MKNRRTSFSQLAVLCLVGAVSLTAGASVAFACRGATGYPEVAQRLAAASLPADQKAALMQRLEDGRALHDRAHQQNDTRLMQESLTILDQIDAALPR